MTETKYPNKTHYSPHLARSEVVCRCGCIMPRGIDQNLTIYAPSWEQVRMLVGQPMHVNCGYRCPRHNATLPGAAPNSQHIHGCATDNTPDSGNEAGVIHIARMALKVPAFANGGISIYSREHGLFCHLDNRKGGRWHSVNGKPSAEAEFKAILARGYF